MHFLALFDTELWINLTTMTVYHPDAFQFGKVYHGIWRETVVAVKQMVMPNNLTGAEKVRSIIGSEALRVCHTVCGTQCVCRD